MINIEKAKKEWKELSQIVKDYKDLQDIYDNSTWVECTNYNKDCNYLDMNYKTICATAHNGDDGKPYLSNTGVEVWDDTGLLDFITIDF